jgi:hypothetical protein
MAQSNDNWPVVDRASTQFKNGALSALLTLVHSAAKGCLEPILLKNSKIPVPYIFVIEVNY